MIERLRSVHADSRGTSLTELLVGTVIGAMIMSVVATMIFTTNGLRLRADDRSQFAADMSITSLSFDRDGDMATVGAPAKLQTISTSCATAIDLGVVQYRTTAGRLERVGGAITRTMVRNVSSCTWQSVKDGTGRSTILVTLGMAGVSGETLTQILRVAPRRW